jgi:hypothetical protein
MKLLHKPILSTKAVDNSVEKIVIKDVNIGFYYSFVKLDQLNTININIIYQLLTILASPYSRLYLIGLIGKRR